MNDLTKDIIRYDVLAQEALRGVVRKVLSEVEKTGSLPGEHHFYITFDTTAPGVRISNAIKERYPEEMTIIVQHQFWDLKVTESRFEIGLSFSDVPEILSIPFNAITGFVDPSVKFVLQFDADEHEHEHEAPILSEVVTEFVEKPRLAEVSDDADSDEPVQLAPKAEAKPAAKSTKKSKAKEAAKDAEIDGADEADAGEGAGESKVVSLDAFRKK